MVYDRILYYPRPETDGPAQDWIWANVAQMEAEIPLPSAFFNFEVEFVRVSTEADGLIRPNLGGIL